MRCQKFSQLCPIVITNRPTSKLQTLIISWQMIAGKYFISERKRHCFLECTEILWRHLIENFKIRLNKTKRLDPKHKAITSSFSPIKDH